MKQFKNLKRGAPSFNKNLKIQQDIKQQFKHVDDSLFAMSLRNPKIAEDITKEIGNVQYNVDKAIETLAEANVPKGNSHQQYAVSSSNKLADMLSDILNGMQMQMSGAGAGKPKPGQGQGEGHRDRRAPATNAAAMKPDPRPRWQRPAPDPLRCNPGPSGHG